MDTLEFKVGDRVCADMGTFGLNHRFLMGVIFKRMNVEDKAFYSVSLDIGFRKNFHAEQLTYLAENMLVCERCGKVITENHGDDNHILCEDCRNSGFYTTCRECGCLIDTIYESYLCYEDEYICDDCKDSGGWEVCADCGCLVQYEDCETDDSDTIVCNDCFRARWTHCNDCGDLVRLSDAHSDDYTTVCDDCFYDRWAFCEDCGTLFNIENEGDRIDDSYYCDNCVDDHRNIIHEYGYKPYPEFYGSGPLYMGVELEIDEGGKDDEAASELADIVDDKMYFKEDGSLNDGFECVTHPMTLSYHLNCFPWDDLCKRAIQLGYTSHNAETCGLHVHVSRNALGNNADEIDATIARILYFFESHWSQMVRFSRRTEGQLDEWAKRYAHKDSVHEYEDDAKSRSHGRYMCVNLQNSSTIEFRIFRGTLKASTIKATLELVDTLCRVCSEHTAADIQQMEWYDFVRLIPEQHTELHEYLKTHGLHIKNTKDEEDEI